MSSRGTSSGDGQWVVGPGNHPGPVGTSRPEADQLDDYVRRTVAGDWEALQALHAVLSPYVRESAACLFGNGGKADIITDEVFVDVWQLAHQYEPGGVGVPAWVLTIAGQHTMSRYQSNTSVRGSVERRRSRRVNPPG
jgi:RNA polymerase sigma-70 factor, ECF subfamily